MRPGSGTTRSDLVTFCVRSAVEDGGVEKVVESVDSIRDSSGEVFVASFAIVRLVV